MLKSGVHNLRERLKKYESAVILFAKDGNISYYK